MCLTARTSMAEAYASPLRSYHPSHSLITPLHHMVHGSFKFGSWLRIEPLLQNVFYLTACTMLNTLSSRSRASTYSAWYVESQKKKKVSLESRRMFGFLLYYLSRIRAVWVLRKQWQKYTLFSNDDTVAGIIVLRVLK